MNGKKKFLKSVFIIMFLILLTWISFEKEWKSTWEYTDEELNACIVAHTAPKVVNHSDEYTINIVVENTGAGVWSNEEDIKLCIWQDEFDWGYRIDLPDNVEVKS